MSNPGLPEGFVYVRDVVPDIVEEMRYATERNFVGAKIDGYEAPRAILTRQAAQALHLAALAAGADGYRLVIFDAYRPERAVRHFLRWAQDAADTRTREAYYPEFADKSSLLAEGYIAARSSHSRGSTVDLTLMSVRDGCLLDTGTDFDRFGPVAAHGAEGLTQRQTENRALLCRLMLGAGFSPYSAEWWHYTLKDEPFPKRYFDFPVA